MAIAVRPRKLIPAPARARQIAAPSPGWSPPSMRSEWMPVGLPRPTACAALTALPVLIGLTNSTPLPGCSGARRASTISRFAPACDSASSVAAAPPGRSSMVPVQTSTLLTLSAMAVPSSGLSTAIIYSQEAAMDRIPERKREIEVAVADVRAIEKSEGVTRVSLEKIKQRLTGLAARKDLFSDKDFPPPGPGGKLKSCLYRVAEDPDHRFALYVNSSLGGHNTPAHNHTTWAVIVGVSGEELNRFYDRSADNGVREKGQ